MTTNPEEHPAFDVAMFEGDRATLRHLFELADDSASAIDRTIGLGRVLVARRDGTVIGMAHLVPTERTDTHEIRAMAVTESAQRRGVGRALIEAAVTATTDAGLARLVVATATADTGNLRFYQRCGFRLVAVELDAFTVAAGYPEGLQVDGIPLRDRAWFELDLTGGIP